MQGPNMLLLRTGFATVIGIMYLYLITGISASPVTTLGDPRTSGTTLGSSTQEVTTSVSFAPTRSPFLDTTELSTIISVTTTMSAPSTEQTSDLSSKSSQDVNPTDYPTTGSNTMLEECPRNRTIVQEVETSSASMTETSSSNMETTASPASHNAQTMTVGSIAWSFATSLANSLHVAVVDLSEEYCSEVSSIFPALYRSIDIKQTCEWVAQIATAHYSIPQVLPKDSNSDFKKLLTGHIHGSKQLQLVLKEQVSLIVLSVETIDQRCRASNNDPCSINCVYVKSHGRSAELVASCSISKILPKLQNYIYLLESLLPIERKGDVQSLTIENNESKSKQSAHLLAVMEYAKKQTALNKHWHNSQ